MQQRRSELSRAARLCAMTIAWNVVVGGAALVTAIVTGSRALEGFGLAAAVDSAASAVLVWRFRAEASGDGRAQRAESLAARVAAVALLLAAAFIAVQAGSKLAGRSRTDESTFGLVQAAASVAVLPLLASAKLRMASSIPSAALRLDGLLTAAAATLAGLALAGLALSRLAGWWWADPVAALVIAALMLAVALRSLSRRPREDLPRS